jgi:hypothetical protein
MGTVDFQRYGGGAMDNELIGGSTYLGIIWIGGSNGTLASVHSAFNSCNGCYVYENGAVTGQSLVQLSGYPYCDNLGGIQSCNVQDTYAVSGVGCQDGDSGNPVFAYDGGGGVTAVGIHHAGNGAGYCIYTELPPILSYWRATITTGYLR